MEPTNRSEVWKDIWTKKGQDKNAPLFVVDGYGGLISSIELDNMIFQVTKPIGLMGTENIFECGCGAGAFLEVLIKIHPELNVSGLDYSPTLLDIARSHFKGDFYVADMTNLGFIPDAKYDLTLCFGAIQYLSSEKSAQNAAEEMLRITKPNGKVYIGEIPDASKKELAESIRRVSHKSLQKVSTANPDHLYLSKDFFRELAKENNLNINIIDHTEFNLGNYQAANYRYSVYLFKKG